MDDSNYMVKKSMSRFITEEANDAKRIWTIHSSKGLGFPF